MISIEKVIEAIAEAGVVPDMARFDPASTFKKNGVDSLDVMTVLLTVEEKLDIKLSEEEAGRITSANDIVTVVNSRS